MSAGTASPSPGAVSGPPIKAPHDLPPRWDGRAVLWAPWRLADDGSLAFHSALADLACQRCGSLARQHWRSSGLVAHESVTSCDELRVAEALGKAGRAGHRRLSVRRCLDCGHDQVLDLDSDELWDLDSSDYGDEGSDYDPQARRATLVQAARDAIRPTRPAHRTGQRPAPPCLEQETLW